MAVRVTPVPAPKENTQMEPQLIPAGELVTTPPPAFEIVSVLFKFENEKTKSGGARVVW